MVMIMIVASVRNVQYMIVIKCYVFMVIAVSVRSVYDRRIISLLKKIIKRLMMKCYVYTKEDIIHVVLVYEERMKR